MQKEISEDITEIEKKYPMTYAVLDNAADRILSWNNVTNQAKTRKQVEIAKVLMALMKTL